jgi:hypothetical protein
VDGVGGGGDALVACLSPWSLAAAFVVACFVDTYWKKVLSAGSRGRAPYDTYEKHCIKILITTF